MGDHVGPERYDSDFTDYEQCPFCDRVFSVQRTAVYTPLRGFQLSPLERHIRSDHHKVKLRKGSNYRWVDEASLAGGRYRPEVPVGSPDKKGSEKQTKGV